VTRSLEYDAVVVGVGVAGLTAATTLAEQGARVCVLAKGIGSTHLAPGTIDVLGYAPEPVENPAATLPEFISAHPEHPYALTGAEMIALATERLAERILRGPQPDYRYVGGLGANHFLPTPVGAIRPSALVPEMMSGGEMRSDQPVCVVGMRVLRDFHASLCAGNLSRAGIQARAIEADVDVGRTESNALGLARRFDDAKFRAEFAAQLALLLRPGERVALPAVLGLSDPHGAWSDLERRLGRPVFEVPTLPPSAPGVRLYNALLAALRTAGGRLVLGAEVVDARWTGARVSALRTRSSGHDTWYGAGWVVLATGGFGSGAIELDSDWRARETILGLALHGMPDAAEQRFGADYLGAQPMSTVGIAVDASLRADSVVNVFVAGAALPGAVPWREGSGEGIALSTGEFVAQSVLQHEGIKATA
jgi:glycerol-3-phosphate dehydrogenase subunit B